MLFDNISKFYEIAMIQEKFSPEFFIELREISSEGELEKFIEERVQPVAKNMGYNFSTEDLLCYENEMAQKLTEQQLENVSGGDVKSWILGGLVSLMALGAGAIGAISSASAEIDSKTVASSTTPLTSEIEKEISVPKKEVKADNDDKTEAKKPLEATNPENEIREEGQSETINQTNQNTEKSDLETAQNATKVNQSEIIESRKLTEDQKLYILQAFNLPDAYALLQSGVIENLRLYGYISEIEIKDGIRQCTGDHGDAFNKLLYKIFPSNPGTLSTAGGGDRPNFSKFGGISPELMAKFCSILNDYRNGKLEIPQKVPIDWLRTHGFDTFEYDEKSRQFDDQERENRKIDDACKKIKSYNGKIDNIDELLKSSSLTTAFEINKIYSTTYNAKETKKSELNKDKKNNELKQQFKNLSEELTKITKDISKDFKDFKPIIINTSYSSKDESEFREKLTAEKQSLEQEKVEQMEIVNESKFDENRKSFFESINNIMNNKKFEEIFNKINVNNIDERKLNEEEKKLLFLKKKLLEISKKKNFENEKEFKKYIVRLIFNNDLQNHTNISLDETQIFSSWLLQKSINEREQASKKLELWGSFVGTLKDAVGLENEEDSSYPKYLTEHILMAYMIKTLNTKEDVEKLYQEIAKQLSQNETNKTAPKASIKLDFYFKDNNNEIQIVEDFKTLDPSKTYYRKGTDVPVDAEEIKKIITTMEKKVFLKNLYQEIAEQLVENKNEPTAITSLDFYFKNANNKYQKLKNYEDLDPNEIYYRKNEEGKRVPVDAGKIKEIIIPMKKKNFFKNLYQEIAEQLVENENEPIVLKSSYIYFKNANNKYQILNYEGLKPNVTYAFKVKKGKFKTLSDDEVKKIEEIIEQMKKKIQEFKKKRQEIEKKIEFEKKKENEKNRIKDLNEVINSTSSAESSPYKSEPQSNGNTYTIGSINEEGKVQFGKGTFQDCADITVRHVLNLLIYSNNKNWDLILRDANIDDLNIKLKEVVDAINSHTQTQFYDLKTRLQMFFLYQRGIVEGDNRENEAYRSKNGADDVSPLARTLWEYVICNMNEKNLKNENGPDKDNGYYPIQYAGENIELETGYENMLKLMWNMASALNLGSETIDGKTKLSWVKENIDKLDDNAGSVEKAIKSTLELFYPSGIKLTKNPASSYGLAKVEVNGLSFKIIQHLGHAYVEHNVHEVSDKLGKLISNNMSIFKILLLRKFTQGTNLERNVPVPTGFYGTFSGEKLNKKDPFLQTPLYQKYNALSVFRALQGEEGNKWRINNLINSNIMDTAKQIKLKGGGTLADVYFERYLVPNFYKLNSNLQDLTQNYFKDNNSIYSVYDEKGTAINHFKYLKPDKNEIKLFLVDTKSIGSELKIPSKVYDKDKKELNVIEILGLTNDIQNLNTLTFNGDFNSLAINRLADGWSKGTNLTVNFTGHVENLTFGKNVFSRTEIKTFNLNGNVENLTFDKHAFSHAEIKTFNLNGNVENLTFEKEAFYYCKSLNTFTIPNGVNSVTIEHDAFDHCTFLNTFIIPESVGTLSIDRQAFSYDFINLWIPNKFSDNKSFYFGLNKDTYGVLYDDVTLMYYEVKNRNLDLEVRDKTNTLYLDQEELEQIMKIMGTDISKIESLNAKKNEVLCDINLFVSKEFKDIFSEKIKSQNKVNFISLEESECISIPKIVGEEKVGSLTLKTTDSNPEFHLRKNKLQFFAKKVGIDNLSAFRFIKLTDLNDKIVRLNTKNDLESTRKMFENSDGILINPKVKLCPFSIKEKFSEELINLGKIVFIRAEKEKYEDEEKKLYLHVEGSLEETFEESYMDSYGFYKSRTYTKEVIHLDNDTLNYYAKEVGCKDNSEFKFIKTINSKGENIEIKIDDKRDPLNEKYYNFEKFLINKSCEKVYVPKDLYDKCYIYGENIVTVSYDRMAIRDSRLQDPTIRINEKITEMTLDKDTLDIWVNGDSSNIEFISVKNSDWENVTIHLVGELKEELYQDGEFLITKKNNIFYPLSQKDNLPQEIKDSGKVVFITPEKKGPLGNWLYLKTDKPVSEITLNEAKLESLAEEVDMNSYDIKFIKAENSTGEEIKIHYSGYSYFGEKLVEEGKHLIAKEAFCIPSSLKNEVPQELIDSKKLVFINAKKYPSQNWLYLRTDRQVEKLGLEWDILDFFAKEVGLSEAPSFDFIKATNPNGEEIELISPSSKCFKNVGKSLRIAHDYEAYNYDSIYLPSYVRDKVKALKNRVQYVDVEIGSEPNFENDEVYQKQTDPENDL